VSRSKDRKQGGGDGAGALQLIPLGGLGEIGKNALLIQSGDNALLIDAGVKFPEEELYGVDLVIPDFSVIAQRQLRLHGLVLTHGHEDHIGAVSYFLNAQPGTTVVGTPLTVGLARAKAERNQATWRSVKQREPIALGPFRVELVHVSHSIPDAAAVVVRANGTTLVVSGDFKFDQTPVDGRPTDIARLAELGKEGVDVLLLDSTNSERPGYSPSEREVGTALGAQFERARGRIIVTTFASNIHRLQMVMDLAGQTRRRVGVIGRSMEESVRISRDLGYLKPPRGVLMPMEELRRFPQDRTVILMTGSQGEPLSALSRISAGVHRALVVARGDTVIFSASPIPGNEGMVARTIDNLFRRGAEVVYGPGSGAHVSGHASAEELRLMTNLLRPRVLIPVHGEYRMLVHNADLAEQVGIPRGRILVGENGTVFEVNRNGHARIAASLKVGNVLVDGLGVGDVGAVVLRDRQHLARDGILIVLLALDRGSGDIVTGPDVVSRGFVYMRESETLLKEVRSRVLETAKRLRAPHAVENWTTVKNAIREDLSEFLYERTHRRPMVLPLVVEV
jgi:ribonuclease J